jgi:hypothetical protein
MALLGEPIRPEVAKQINLRQKKHGITAGRDSETYRYLNTKTAWIKLASGVKINDSSDIAKANVLFGGVSSLSSTVLNQRTETFGAPSGSYDYKNSGNFGYIPMPGLISAEIKCLNRGSIKKATVELKVQSADQFDTIEKLYLRLGYTVLLEWGWGTYFDNDGNLQTNYYTLTEDPNGFFKQTDPNVILDKIVAYRGSKSGNYDALLAKVSNFSWTINEEGVYSITLTLISMGDIIESLKINISPALPMQDFIKATYALYNEASSEEEVTKDKRLNPTPADNYISSYLFLQKLFSDENNFSTGIPKSQILVPTSCDAPSYSNGSYISLCTWFIKRPVGSGGGGTGTVTSFTIVEREWSNFYTDAKVVTTNEYGGKYSAAIDLGDNASPFHVMNQPPGLYFSVDTTAGWVTGYYTYIYRIAELDLDGLPFAEPDDNIYIAYNDSTGDEDDMLVDKGYYIRLGHLISVINEHVIPKDSPGLNKITYISDFNTPMYKQLGQISYDPEVCIVASDTDETLTHTGDKGFFMGLTNWWESAHQGNLMNIYMNSVWINTAIEDNMDEKGNLSLFDFLLKICEGINKAMGGVNNLEPIINEQNNVISILDANYVKMQSPKTPYQLNLYGHNGDEGNFVTNFEIKTEITNEFATMATIGSTAGGYVKGVENTMFSKWNKGLVDRYKEKFVPGDRITREYDEANPDKESPWVLYQREFVEKYFSAWGCSPVDVEWDVLTPDVLALNSEIIGNNVAVATEYWKWYEANIHKRIPRYASPSSGFIPINLSITMDGISGIKIYNAIDVQTGFLPANYPESLLFIIKGVNHSIKDNNWTTNIETITVSKPTFLNNVEIDIQ